MKIFASKTALISPDVGRANRKGVARFASLSLLAVMAYLMMVGAAFAQTATDLSGVAGTLTDNLGALGAVLSVASVIAGITLVIMGLLGLISDNPQKSKASAVIKIIIGALLIGITAVIAITQGTVFGGTEIQQGVDGFFN